jgi:hypothetical protein
MQNNVVFYCDAHAPDTFDDNKIYVNNIEQLKRIIDKNFYTWVTLKFENTTVCNRCPDCQELVKSILVDPFYEMEIFFNVNFYITNWRYAQEIPVIEFDCCFFQLRLNIDANKQTKIANIIYSETKLLDTIKEGSVITFYSLWDFDKYKGIFENNCYELKNQIIFRHRHYIVNKKATTKKAIK